MNLNDVVVWLKCLEEAAYEVMLEKQCGRLWVRVETIPDEKGNKKKHVFIHDSNSINSLKIVAYPNILAEKFDKHVLREAFEPYAKIFMEPGKFRISRIWDQLRDIRNKLIHTGIPVSHEPEITMLILDFIGLNIKTLNSAIVHLQSGNLKALIEYEQKCLNNRFFLPLRNIAGFSDPNHILFERKICVDYLNILHS